MGVEDNEAGATIDDNTGILAADDGKRVRSLVVQTR
jgi:hypothetical protein